MAMTRAQKEAEVAALHETLSSTEIVVLTQNKGLDSTSTADLRVKMREGGVNYKVAKNTLAKIAIKGTQYESLADMLKGPTAMATSSDPVAAAKAANDFAKKNDNFVIIGGAMGEVMLDADAIKKLASLPSLDELRSKIVGLLVAAPTKLAGLMQAPAREVVGVTKAYSEKG